MVAFQCAFVKSAHASWHNIQVNSSTVLQCREGIRLLFCQYELNRLAFLPPVSVHNVQKSRREEKKNFKTASSHCSKLHQCDCLRWRKWGVSASWGLHWSLKLRAFLKPTAHTVAHAFMRSSPNERRCHTMDLNRCCHRLQKQSVFHFATRFLPIKGSVYILAKQPQHHHKSLNGIFITAMICSKICRKI